MACVSNVFIRGCEISVGGTISLFSINVKREGRDKTQYIKGLNTFCPSIDTTNYKIYKLYLRKIKKYHFDQHH